MTKVHKIVKSIIGLTKNSVNPEVVIEIFKKAKSDGFPVYSVFKIVNAMALSSNKTDLTLSNEGWIDFGPEMYPGYKNEHLVTQSKFSDSHKTEDWINVQPGVLNSLKIDELIFNTVSKEVFTEQERKILYNVATISGISNSETDELIEQIIRFKENISLKVKEIVLEKKNALYDNEDESFYDPRDSRKYKLIRIGEQVWMAENLAWLPKVSNTKKGFHEPGFYVYNYNNADVSEAKSTYNFKTYGVLYNWAAAKVACPPGWHLPNISEWEELINILGSTDVAGGRMKSKTGWPRPNKNAYNESGFEALPGGYFGINGNFRDIGGYCNFWTSDFNIDCALYFLLAFDKEHIYRDSINKEFGLSVRCIRN